MCMHNVHVLYMAANCLCTIAPKLCTDILTEYCQVSFATIAPKLCADGLDLLTQMLRYEPGQRISAKAAMSHPYFKELDQTRFKAV